MLSEVCQFRTPLKQFNFICLVLIADTYICVQPAGIKMFQYKS